MSQIFRALSECERIAFEEILSVEFRGHQKLRAQIYNLALHRIDETLFELAPLSVLMKVKKNAKRFGVSVECTYLDKDGAIVYVDLFVDEHDVLIELEIWKPNGSVIQTYFADADLCVKVQTT